MYTQIICYKIEKMNFVLFITENMRGLFQYLDNQFFFIQNNGKFLYNITYL